MLRPHHVPALAALFVLVAGCKATPREGWFACDSDSDCPSGYTCRADRRCYSTASQNEDGGRSDGGGCASNAECGAATECASPVCEDGACSPGFLPATTDLPDPTPGDCQRFACTGDSAEPVLVNDDTDAPQLPCSMARCVDGAAVTDPLAAGEACLDGSGVCDGAGTGASSCKNCVPSEATIHPGCTDEQPECDPDAEGGRGACRPRPTTWDPTWGVLGAVFSDDNLSISSPTTDHTVNVRTRVGRSSGKYYWEIRTTAGDANTNAGGIGIVEENMAPDAEWIGAVEGGMSFGYSVPSFNRYWVTWSGASVLGAPPLDAAIHEGNVYMFALDMDTGRLWVGHNGTWYNEGDPTTGANPAMSGITGRVYPGVTFYAFSINAFTANFGASAFEYPVPAGFRPGFF